MRGSHGREGGFGGRTAGCLKGKRRGTGDLLEQVENRLLRLLLYPQGWRGEAEKLGNGEINSERNCEIVKMYLK